MEAGSFSLNHSGYRYMLSIDLHAHDDGPRETISVFDKTTSEFVWEGTLPELCARVLGESCGS